MIGVIANPSEHAVVSEFFELFKTPWEFYRSGQQYEVLLSAGDADVPEHAANLVLIYAGHRLPFDTDRNIETTSASGSCFLAHKGTRIPIYGGRVTLGEGSNLLVDEATGRAAAYVEGSPERTLVRIGYDVFSEVRTLLTAGQPAANAAFPTLELHIALLRELIVGSKAPLVEIPAVPDGHRFIACLTHDVDHPLIRRHKWDHTILGFLHRAVIGSAIGVLQGRRSIRELFQNWTAALKLPFVYLDLAKDFWSGFDRYPELEKGARSTFFVIPFEGYPGKGARGFAPAHRAARYGAADIAEQIRSLQSQGCEVSLHGIDAWLSSSTGRAELEEIKRVSGTRSIGVRMHWLYQDDHTAAKLERAGADYDSTVGYNETVGYRAGTTQVYKPLAVKKLLELPLHVMDTSLFYPSHLNLSPGEAGQRVGQIVDNVASRGGCVTVNWHDRSIAPERLWGRFYSDLVEELADKGACFLTAAQTVAWFRKRRSVVFERDGSEVGGVRAVVTAAADVDLPDLQLRIHEGRAPHYSRPLRSEGEAHIATLAQLSEAHAASAAH